MELPSRHPSDVYDFATAPWVLENLYCLGLMLRRGNNCDSFYETHYTLKRQNKPRRPRGGVEVQLYFFFNLGGRWRLVVNATPRPIFPPGKTRYTLYRRLGGPQGRFGRVRKKISPHTGIRSPDCPARSQSLYRLSYPGPHNILINS